MRGNCVRHMYPWEYRKKERNNSKMDIKPSYADSAEYAQSTNKYTAPIDGNRRLLWHGKPRRGTQPAGTVAAALRAFAPGGRGEGLYGSLRRTTQNRAAGQAHMKLSESYEKFDKSAF